MDEYPNLVITVYTYDRPEYAERTIRSTLANLRYAGGVFVHVADDGSPEGQAQAIARAAEQEAEGRDYSFRGVTITNADRHGYGASYNLATQVTHILGSVFLSLEDDWECRGDLNLTPLVDALYDEAAAIECIRLGYIGWTQELRGKIAAAAGQTFLLLDPFSPERHVLAGHPRLETLRFQRLVGPWPEGINAGATEFEVCGRMEARGGVAWPLDLGISAKPSGKSLYHHIGAIQARDDQREAASI